MAAGAGRTLAYDYDNRLTQVVSGTITTTMVYDGDGGRVKKIVAQGDVITTTVYIGKLFEVTAGVAIRHIFAGDNRVADVRVPGGVLYYHSDHLGSANVISNEAGQRAELLEYYPFGEIRVKILSDGVDVAHKFTGKELDAETGLYFYEARYYDPALARFITPDTIISQPGDPQDFNRYTYARNNPLKYTDPTGHKFKWKNIFKHIVNAIRVIIDIVKFPVDPIGSTLDLAAVATSYAKGETAQKASQILGWASAGWQIGTDIYKGLTAERGVVFPKGGAQDVSKYDRMGVGGWGWTKEYAQSVATEKGFPFYYVKTAGPPGLFTRAVTWKFFPGAPSRELLGYFKQLPVGASVMSFSEGTILTAGALEMTRGGLRGLQVYSLGSAVSEARMFTAAANAGATLAGYGADPVDLNTMFTVDLKTMFTPQGIGRILWAGVGGIATRDSHHDLDRYMQQFGLEGETR
jgi:RHS repeat-associated protein